MSGKGQHHKLSENAYTVTSTVNTNSKQSLKLIVASQLYPKKTSLGSQNNAMYLLITDTAKVSVFKAAFL
jgi:hypothetical protein